jgi:hypothetical protein
MKELQDGLLALKSRPPAIFTAADWEKLVVRNGLADENETIGADEFVAVASSSVLSILMHELGMVDATMPSLDVASSHQGSSFAAIASGIKAILLWLNLHTIHTDKRASGCGGEGGRVGGGRRIADEDRGRGCYSEGVSVNGLIAEEKSRQQVGEVMGQILQELKELNSRVALIESDLKIRASAECESFAGSYRRNHTPRKELQSAQSIQQIASCCSHIESQKLDSSRLPTPTKGTIASTTHDSARQSVSARSNQGQGISQKAESVCAGRGEGVGEEEEEGE